MPDPDITTDTTPTLQFTARDGATLVATFTAQPTGSSVSNSILITKTGLTPTLATTTVNGGYDTYKLQLPTLAIDGEYTVSITADIAERNGFTGDNLLI